MYTSWFKGKKIQPEDEIKNVNCRVGLAINPDTEVNEIQKYLPDLDEVTVMTVVPGKGGQKLIQSCLLKVEKLVKIRTKLNLNYLMYWLYLL